MQFSFRSNFPYSGRRAFNAAFWHESDLNTLGFRLAGLARKEMLCLPGSERAQLGVCVCVSIDAIRRLSSSDVRHFEMRSIAIRRSSSSSTVMKNAMKATRSTLLNIMTYLPSRPDFTRLDVIVGAETRHFVLFAQGESRQRLSDS